MNTTYSTILNQLNDLTTSVIADGSHSLSIRKTTNGEIMVEGNRAGLTMLAMQILKVADRDFAGAHYHLDELGMSDSCEMPLIFVRVN